MSDMTAAPEAALRPPVALSVVIPVYRSGEIFPELHRRLTAALVPLGNYEIVAVVDGGGDETAEIIARHCAADSRLKMAEMSRNFGEEAAVSAGLSLSKGEMVLVMDDDLEDPPEEIPRFVAKAEEGYDVVYGIIARREVSAFRGTAFRLFYRTLNFLTDIKMPNDAGSFCLMRRPVVDALNAMPENNRYIRGMRVWIGYRQTGLSYERHERAGGVSGYTFTKYLRFGVNAILSFSHKPLDYVVGLGMLVSLFAFAEGAWILLHKLMGGEEYAPPGWVTNMVMVLFLGGVQLLSIGVVGQYVGRIYEEVKRRPGYLLRRRIGFDDPEEKP